MMISWDTQCKQLAGFISRRIDNPMDAEDVLQDVMIKAYLKREQLVDETSFRGWIYAIARNAIIDYYRSKRNELLPIDDWDSVLQAPDDASGPAGALVDCVNSMVETLPDKYRAALIAADLYEIPQYHLGDHLGLSYSGAKSRVQRAREKLRTILESRCAVEVNQYRDLHCEARTQSCCA